MKAVQALVSHPNVAVSTLLTVMLTTVEMIKVSSLCLWKIICSLT